MRSRKNEVHERDLIVYAEWEWNYSQVETFVRERGHCNLGEHPAGDWLRQQLQASTAGKLSVERQQRLTCLGVSLDPGDDAWEAMLQRVRDVLMRCRVPRKRRRERWLPEPLDGDLASWLREQRALHKAGMLHPDRRRKLRGLKLLVAVGMPDPLPGVSRVSHLVLEARERRYSAKWECRYQELVAYKQEHGDCDVPRNWPENKALANWVRFQRKRDHLGRMTDAHRSRLDELDFPWSLRRLPADKRWERRFQELVKFKETHGHTRVPKRFDERLWHWRHVQREFRRKGILNPVRIARLDAIGFEWEEDPVWGRTWDPIKEQHWDAKLQQLAEYCAQYGNINVPQHGKKYTQLGRWLNRQRMDCRNGHLRPDRLVRLEALGFVAIPGRSSLDESWDERYAELAAFYEQHGHTRVTSKIDDRLSEWRYLQRANHRKGLLSAELIARLDALGFEWVEPESSGMTQQERWDKQWLEMYQQMVLFQREHGHCHVTTKWKGNPRLAEWVQDQRTLKSQGKLRPERLTRLEALGFLWTAENIDSNERWERRFHQLCDFQQQHGHTRVPKSFDKQLWHWRHVQREFRKKNLLKPDRIARLDALGFEWEEQGKPWARSREERWERQWDAMYAQLVEFQRQHGTTHVVAGWPENPRLAAWVGDQREGEHQGGLRADRKARLDAIGFIWNPGRPTLVARWEERYAQLVAFQEQHGHTRVPKGLDRHLWRWRHVQREFRKKDLLSAERIARLDAIGFEWEGRDPA